jgi:hypothetical protein
MFKNTGSVRPVRHVTQLCRIILRNIVQLHIYSELRGGVREELDFQSQGRMGGGGGAAGVGGWELWRNHLLRRVKVTRRHDKNATVCVRLQSIYD